MSFEAHATNTISTNSGTPPVGPLGLWVFGSLGLWEWMQPQRHNDTTGHNGAAARVQGLDDFKVAKHEGTKSTWIHEG